MSKHNRRSLVAIGLAMACLAVPGWFRADASNVSV